MAKGQRCVMECIDKDGNPRLARATLPTCGTCGSNMGIWMRRRPAERMKYRDTLALRARRMELVTQEKREGKFEVINVRPRKKRKS
jgi:hypothetical protein